MSGETCEQEWERLRAERRMLRDRVAECAAGLSAKAHDPFGLKAIVRRHPIASALTGAGAAALIATLLSGRKKAPADGDAPADESSDGWGSFLRRGAIGVVVPWIARFVREKFASGADAEPHATNGEAPRDHVPTA